MLEYGPIPDDRQDEFRSLVTYGFLPERGPRSFDPEDEIPVPAQVGESRGLYEDGDLVCGCKRYPFRAHLADEVRSMTGVSIVATPPEHRRRGLARRLMAESLMEDRERGITLTALWPFEHSFYARLGWALVGTYGLSECPPAALAGTREHRSGRFIRLGADDWQRAASVLQAVGEPYALSIDRSEEWWRKRIFSGWEEDPFVYGWECEGELRGYLVYQFDADGDDRTLRVWELAAAEHEARTNLLGFLADHDSQVKTIRLYGPPETGLFDLVDDPGKIEVKMKPGPMLRLVDIREAIEAWTFPPIDDQFTLAVEDPLVDWHDGIFQVSVSGGVVSVRETDEPPEVTIGIGPLTQLYVGYRSLRELEEADACSISSPEAAELLAEAFPTRDVFLREGF